MRQRLLLFVGSILMALLLAEIVLRIAGISYPYFTRADRDTGFSLRPDAEGWVRDEGKAYVKIASHGFRDRERSLQKPEGITRIAVLGDSFIEARQVALEDALPAVLEQKLRTCGNIEVLNFGISGFSTIQELQLLPRALAFDPDLVIVAFTPGNDVRGNSKELSNGSQQPYLVKHDDGSYALDLSFRDTKFFTRQTSFLSRTAFAIINYSRIAQILNRARKAIMVPGILKVPGTFGKEAGLDDEIYRERSDAMWEEAWTTTEEAFSRIRDAVRANDADLLITVVSSAAQVHPDPAKRSTNSLAPVHRIERIGDRLDVPVISLVEPLQRYAKEHGTFLHGFGEGLGSGHWNAEGHRVAAEALATFLCERCLASSEC